MTFDSNNDFRKKVHFAKLMTITRFYAIVNSSDPFGVHGKMIVVNELLKMLRRQLALVFLYSQSHVMLERSACSSMPTITSSYAWTAPSAFYTR